MGYFKAHLKGGFDFSQLGSEVRENGRIISHIKQNQQKAKTT